LQRQSPSLRNVTHSAYVWEPFANEIRHVEVYQKKKITTRKVLRPTERVVTDITPQGSESSKVLPKDERAYHGQYMRRIVLHHSQRN